MFFKEVEKRDIVLLFLGGLFLIIFGLFLANDETSMVKLGDKNKSQIKEEISSNSNNGNNSSVLDSSSISGEVIYGDLDSNDLVVSNDLIDSDTESKDVSASTTINDNQVQVVDDNIYGSSDYLEVANSSIEDDMVSPLLLSDEVMITLLPSTKTMKVGESFTFKVETTAESGSFDIVKYQSSNRAIVDIDQNGVVVAKGMGTAIITAQLSSSISTATVNVLENNLSNNIVKDQTTKKKQNSKISTNKSQTTKKSQSSKTKAKKSQTTKKSQNTKANTSKNQGEKKNSSNKNGVVNNNQNKNNDSSVNKNSGMPIPNYYQVDYSDVSLMPGTDRTVASSGCGFTSCSMIVSYLTGKRITPREFVGNWSRKYYVYNSGMSWSLPQAAATHYNLGKVEQTTSTSRMVQALKNNQPVMSSQGPGLFTQNGHLIVLRGITANGKILVNDPNKSNAVGKGYNNKRFSVEQINASNKVYFIFPKKK